MTGCGHTTMILIDTNILVYAHRRATAEHERAVSAIEQACTHPAGCAIAVASATEFTSVVTHPSIADGPSTIGQAAGFLSLLVKTGGLKVLAPGATFFASFLQAAQDLSVCGARLFDLQIAVTGKEHGASQIWTHDKKFVRLPGLEVCDPLSTN